MVPNDALLNRLRAKDLDFHFKRQSDRMMLYKQNGTSKRVEIRRNAFHDEDYARTVLRLAGLESDAIEAFIRQTRN